MQAGRLHLEAPLRLGRVAKARATVGVRPGRASPLWGCCLGCVVITHLGIFTAQGTAEVATKAEDIWCMAAPRPPAKTQQERDGGRTSSSCPRSPQTSGRGGSRSSPLATRTLSLCAGRGMVCTVCPALPDLAAAPHPGPLLTTALLPCEALSPAAAGSGTSARTGLYPRHLSFHQISYHQKTWALSPARPSRAAWRLPGGADLPSASTCDGPAGPTVPGSAARAPRHSLTFCSLVAPLRPQKAQCRERRGVQTNPG